MQRLLGLVAAVLLAGYAFGQTNPGVPTSGADGVTTQQLADAVAASQVTIMAAMPQPADAVPPTDTTTGAIGASAKYMRQDAPRPARYRSGTCTIAGGAGACTITWTTPFSVTPNALGDPSALNTSPATTQYNCNWTALSTTQGSVVCRSSVLGIAVLGAILSFLANGVVVTGNAITPI